MYSEFKDYEYNNPFQNQNKIKLKSYNLAMHSNTFNIHAIMLRFVATIYNNYQIVTKQVLIY